jgi:hypothetical protein
MDLDTFTLSDVFRTKSISLTLTQIATRTTMTAAFERSKCSLTHQTKASLLTVQDYARYVSKVSIATTDADTCRRTLPQSLLFTYQI